MEAQAINNGHHTATVTDFLQNFSVKETRSILFDMYSYALNADDMDSVRFAADSFFHTKNIVAFLEKLEAENRAYNTQETQDSLLEQRS
jgi:hypothetical protein